jgi:hypothetical protein
VGQRNNKYEPLNASQDIRLFLIAKFVGRFTSEGAGPQRLTIVRVIRIISTAHRSFLKNFLRLENALE